jgi:hypothetical protein
MAQQKFTVGDEPTWREDGDNIINIEEENDSKQPT